MSNLSDVLSKLSELERKVADTKDWKQKFEEAEKAWGKAKEGLEKKVEAIAKLRELLTGILDLHAAPQPTGATRTLLNLAAQELVVNMTHQEKELNLTTNTVIGKVLYSALTELARDGFGEAELTEALKEHGWNIPHNTLAPTLGGLARDGYLVRIEKTRPVKYRLPAKVKMNIKKE